MSNVDNAYNAAIVLGAHCANAVEDMLEYCDGLKDDKQMDTEEVVKQLNDITIVFATALTSITNSIVSLKVKKDV